MYVILGKKKTKTMPVLLFLIINSYFKQSIKKEDLTALYILYIQSTLVISTSVISNNRLSRRKNPILVITQKSKIRL